MSHEESQKKTNKRRKTISDMSAKHCENVKNGKSSSESEKRLSLFNTDIISQTIFQDN